MQRQGYPCIEGDEAAAAGQRAGAPCPWDVGKTMISRSRSGRSEGWRPRLWIGSRSGRQSVTVIGSPTSKRKWGTRGPCT